MDIFDVDEGTWKPTLVYKNKTKPDESKPSTPAPEDKSVIMKIGKQGSKQDKVNSSALESSLWKEGKTFNHQNKQICSSTSVY